MYKINNNEHTFVLPNFGDITISGYSKSAFRTGYIVKPFNIHLDAGLPSPYPPSLILLSHGHFDHIASLYSILDQNNNCPVMLPDNLIDNTTDMLLSFKKLNSCHKTHTSGMEFKWNPISDTKFNIKIKGKQFEIDTFNLDHRVTSIGFGISMLTKKLKEEYTCLESKEIVELKKTTNIFEIKKQGCILFISDTGKKPLKYLPFNDYQIVIIECTFFDDEHYMEAIERKHLHWKDLEPYIKNNPNTKFCLGHFSTRYKDEYIQEKYTELKELYPNVFFYL